MYSFNFFLITTFFSILFKMSQFDRNELVNLAEKCSEKGCHEDVISYMKEVVKMGTPLNYKERNMVFYSYNELILPYVNLYDSYKYSSYSDEKLRREINLKAQSVTNRISDEIIQLLNSYWVKRDNNIKAVAHYKCFLAEQHDYKASVTSDSNRELNISKASSLFEEAYEIANKILNPAHPVVIDVAISYSDFIFCLLGSVDKALNISTEALNKAETKLPELPDELKSWANEGLERLSENINKWKTFK